MADEGYSNFIAEQGESEDLGSAIQELIKSNIINANTAKLAQITAINGNKISFKPVMKRNADDVEMVVNNVMIAFQYSGEWQEQFKLKVGDIGLVVVIQDDISSFKYSGKGGACNTKRFKDINDAIFYPCALFKALDNSSINYILQNTAKSCKLEFDNSEIGTLKAKLLVLESESTTLKAKLGELTSLLESLASGSTGPDGHGHTSTTSPGSVGKFSAWQASLDSLFAR